MAILSKSHSGIVPIIQMRCFAALNLCDLDAFGPLKKILAGQCFSNDEKVKMGCQQMDAASWMEILARYNL